jgi:multidrug resistance efflux pump
MRVHSVLHKTQEPALLFSPVREQWLEEFAQAVELYQNAVLALHAIDRRTAPEIVRSLLAQADTAKAALKQCQIRSISDRMVDGKLDLHKGCGTA